MMADHGSGGGVRYLFRAIFRSVTATLLVVGLLLSPQAWLAARTLAFAADGAVADYRLRQIPPQRYEAEIAAALDHNDGDLARSLLALAQSQEVAVPPGLVARIAALPAVDVGNVLQQGWNCVVNGDFDSEAGLACVVATDLSGVGDVRDLVGEGTHYLTGQPVNYFTLGVATVGLGLTVSTVMSLGGTLPVKTGVSFLKAMSKVGKLPVRLVGEVGARLGKSIDKAALAETVNLGREFRLGEMGGPLARVFNPKAAAVVTDLATDFGRIGKAGGVRAMKLSAEASDSVADVRLLARAADRYQGRFLGVMKLLGHGVLRLGKLLVELGAWLVGAALWLFGLTLFVLRWSSRTARLLVRLVAWPIRRLWRPPAMLLAT
ncbi:MAG: hypothetical protein ABT13_01490 [Pelagibacterium sp. SCN 68-10]|nr:MAG: hypothetical protein ABT13_01490 [Pelagibacterium sp. SCN 68-10]